MLMSAMATHANLPRSREALRPARSSDAHQLARFERRVFTGYYASHRFSRAQFQYYLARPQTISYVAQRHGTIAGYVLGIQRGGRLHRAARVLSIGVDADHRDQGLGSRLLTAFMEESRRRGGRFVSLEVATVNDDAVRLFASHGFSTLRRLPGYYSASVDGFRMRLIL